MDATAPSSPLQQGDFIFVISGPGAGKGTQCHRLALSLNLVHISFGDVQRAELAKPDSKLAHLRNDRDRLGNLAPDDLSVQMLRERIDAHWAHGKRQFLLDGFPRSVGQAEEFEKKVGRGLLMLLFDAPEQTRRERVVGRGRVSGRAEDNARDFGVRNERFARLSPPVIGMFEERGLLVKVDCRRTADEVYREVRCIVAMWVQAWKNPEFLWNLED